MIYADTNFFVRVYLQLSETALALQAIEKLEEEKGRRLPITWLHRIELVNAFHLHVFAGRQGASVRVTPEQAAAAHAIFRTDASSGRFLASTQIPLDALESKVEELSLRQTNKFGFRTYDLLHVASALLLACDTFWSFDVKACKLAALEGLSSREFLGRF